MCGIAGLVDFTGKLGAKTLRDLSVSMADTMVHRGPDSSGVWVEPSGYCAFSHRRLSIIDTSAAGHQPMESFDNRYCITFNGEIYNFQELRPEIESRGHVFRTRTDTEVLIEAMRLWGTDAFLRMDGMYAFALYDRHRKEIILGRDPFGEKPLYYHATPMHFAFASELQALQRLPFFDDSVSADGLAEYLCFQYIGAPRTFYRNVRKVPPGHYMVLRDDGSYTLHRYFEFRPGEGDLRTASLDELADELEEILLRSIRRRLISDVPLGAFLSGGVDSSTVVALVRKALGLPVKTFSIGFSETEETEHIAAKRFAVHLGTEHREKILLPDANRFLHEIGGLLDEPNGDSSCLPTYLLSEFARTEVTVAVSGDGGDEMFGGYGRYFSTLQEGDARARGERVAGWNPGNAYYSSRILVFTEEHIRELFGIVPDGLREILSFLRRNITSGCSPSLLDRMRKTDVENYMPGAVLPKVDRMSMRHSLEVRTPFLNMELARFAERLPLSAMYHEGVGKLVLRKVACRYLPEAMVNAPKKGFGLPVSRWGQSELLHTAAGLLEGDDSKIADCLGKAAVSRFMSRQRSENGFSTYQVWALSVLESYFRSRPASLPAVGSELHIEHLSRPNPDCQELALLHDLLGKGSPLVLFCTDSFPAWLGEFPLQCMLVSNRKLASYKGVENVCLDWLDESYSWIDLLPAEKIQGAIAWFYANAFSPHLIISRLACAGFSEVIASSACCRGYLTVDLGRFVNDRIPVSRIHQMGELLSENSVKSRALLAETRKRVRSSFFNLLRIRKRLGRDIHELFRGAPLVHNLFRKLMKIFSVQLGTATAPIAHEKGWAYKCTISLKGKTLRDRESSSSFVLIEDDVPLPGTESLHEDIRNYGGGRFSVWNNDVVFSSSDNSNPITNKRKYVLLSKKIWRTWQWLLRKPNPYELEGDTIPPAKEKGSLNHYGGFCYTSRSPFLDQEKDTECSSRYVLFEDDVPLLTPPCSHEDIRNLGRGRYSVWNNDIFFSSSDNSDPNLNGRDYYLVKRKPEYEALLDYCAVIDDKDFVPLFLDAIREDNQKAPLGLSRPQAGDKIVLFTHALSSGGAERQWCYLARELDKRGYSVTMVVLHSLAGRNGHYLYLLKGTGVTIRSLSEEITHFSPRLLSDADEKCASLLKFVPSYLSRDVAPFFLYLKEIQPRYVLCQLDGINIIGGVAAWLAGVPRILLSTRNMNPSHFSYIYNPWFRDLYLALTASYRVAMSGNSKAGNSDYAEWLGIPLRRYALIRNGLDAVSFDKVTPTQLEALRKEFGLTAENRLICGVFRFSPEKQPLLFLDVVEKLCRQLPELKVVVAGEGPLHEEMSLEIHRKGLQGVVSLLGRRGDVAAVITLSDVFLLTSAQEGTPNVLLEAQYLGVPVVATSVGGVPDAMMDGITGFICPHDDPEKMADRSFFLLTHESERRKMGAAGRQFIIENFSIDSMVEKTIAALADEVV